MHAHVWIAKNLECLHVNDELMCTCAIHTTEQYWVMILKVFSHVVCIEDADSQGICQVLGSHHRYIYKTARLAISVLNPKELQI
jgi:hypothetical protein